MATAIPYTRVTASRYGFGVLDITVNRASTPDARDIAVTVLQGLAQSFDVETKEFLLEQWAEAGATEDGFKSFMLDTHTQHWEDAFSVSFKHYLVHD